MNKKEKIDLYRSRFWGRQDVFGRRGTHSYNPVCDNLWSDNCAIKNKTGGCGTCSYKKYTPVSDDSIWKHISGEEQQIQYVLLEDGTIKFAAVDLDFKEGKEKIGYTFDDVALLHKQLDAWKIPHAVARSTTAGYHVYFFMQDFYPANRFRSFILHLYDKVGFMEMSRQNVRPLPEIFPKSSSSGPGGIGNGLKTGLIESQIEKGKNCFVDENNEVIIDQWGYFARVPSIQTTALEALIKAEDIEIFEDVAGGKSYRSVGPGGLAKGPRGKWEPPLIGSIEKVVEGCAAFRKLRDKCKKGEVLGHDEGFALFFASMHTADGLEYFRNNVPGWGNTDKDEAQLRHSLQKNYAPLTCASMQQRGICVAGTKCFDKKPPIDMADGQIVIRTEVPESQWPDPSPIRYAFGKGDDFLKRLQEEAQQLVNEADLTTRASTLKGLIARAQVFDQNQQDAFREYLEEIGLAKRRDLNKYFKDAEHKKEAELKASAQDRTDVVMVGDTMFRKLEPFGYSIQRKLKGNQETTARLCDFDIWVDEIRCVTEDDKPRRTVYAGRFAREGFEKKFELDSDDWVDNTKFMSAFGRLCHSNFNVAKPEIDDIRKAAVRFSEKRRIQHGSYLSTQGWHEGAYLSPSVIIDREGVRANTERQVDLSNKEYLNHFDFRVLNDADFRDILFHLKKDFFRAWPTSISYTAIAHTLQAAIRRPLGIRVKPALWFEGLTGTGKSKLTELMQQFYGEFNALLSIQSSWKSMLNYGYDFQDGLVVVDDFKNTSKEQMAIAYNTIQYGYEDTARGILKRNQEQQVAKFNRSLFMFSGEQSPSNEASMIARMIIVPVARMDHTKTTDSYGKCFDLCKFYNGITPRFIHWFLLQDRNLLQQELASIKAELQKAMANETNSSRVADNLSFNFLSWKLFVQMMRQNEVVDEKEAKKLLDDHWATIEDLRKQMISRCAEETVANRFIEGLTDLINSHRVKIRNLEGFDEDHNLEIGFVKNQDSEPGLIYIFAKIAIKEVIDSMPQGEKIAIQEKALSAQLIELGYIVDKDEGRSRKLVRNGKGRSWVWVMSLEKLGLEIPKPRVVQQTEPLPLNEKGLL